MSGEQLVNDHHIEIRTYFVRWRNALVARGCFTNVYIDYYLHLADYGLKVAPDAAEFAKRALASLGLHCASRPRGERIAWTVNFQSPLINVFAAGDNPGGTLVVNTFTEDVKVADRCMFYADTIKTGAEPRRSVIDFDSNDFFAAVEQFYAQSEQRPARLFEFSEDDFVLVSAQPDCDLEWLSGLDLESIRDLDKTQELSLLETRTYQFSCGCDQGRMLEILAPLYRQDAEALIGDDAVLRMTCPRCGAKHAITREALEAKSSGLD